MCLVAVALAALLLGGANFATAAPLRVIWSRGTLVYLEALDSDAFGLGDSLAFALPGERLARGTVVRSDPGRLVEAELFEGTLPLERATDGMISIAVSRAITKHVAKFAVGLPSPARSSPLFACGSGSLREATLPLCYRVASSGRKRFTLVRDSLCGEQPGPDTLLVVWFDHVSDQEIALERGELDAAAFWPGELSTHMREQTRWQSYALGIRLSGLLVARAVTGLPPRYDVPRTPTAADTAALGDLRANRFRQELAAIPPPGPSASHGELAFAPPPRNALRSRILGFETDPACTAEAPFWQRGATPANRRQAGPGLVVKYVEAADPTPAFATPGVVGVFHIFCPVLFQAPPLFQPGRHDSTTPFDVAALVNLMGVLPPSTPR